jgi:hypothetical protein
MSVGVFIGSFDTEVVAVFSRVESVMWKQNPRPEGMSARWC